MDGKGKHVAWLELYLDLVFVLAVAQLAHLVEEPGMHSVWIALGLFFTPRAQGDAGAATDRDLPARRPAARAVTLRVPVAADRRR